MVRVGGSSVVAVEVVGRTWQIQEIFSRQSQPAFVDRLDMWCEMKKINKDYKDFFGWTTKKMELPLTKMGKTTEVWENFGSSF